MEPTSVCDPQPVGPSLPILLNGQEVWNTEQLDISESCEVSDVRLEPDFLVLDFACAQEQYSVSLASTVLPSVVPGDQVELSLFVYSPWWGDAYVKVTRDGELHVAAMAGESLPVGGIFPPDDFFAPLSVEVLDDVCDPEPYGEEKTGILGGRECTQDQRLAMSFGLGGDTTTVFDHNAGSLGELEVHVGRAVSHVEVFCTDTPSGWREFIAVRPR